MNGLTQAKLCLTIRGESDQDEDIRASKSYYFGGKVFKFVAKVKSYQREGL